MSLVYRRCMSALDKVVPQKFQPFWNHAAGPKTVFFWAPMFKWGLVLAGIGDMARPADKLSIPQSLSLAATGTIWSRYSLVIIPKNWSLFSVNVFVGITSIYQLGRAITLKIDMATYMHIFWRLSRDQLSWPYEKLTTTGGPKTVFFWGAVVKGGLVAAGLGDLMRPAEKLSSSQSLSLAVTGVIWSRWCLVIIPKNYPLFVINFFVATTNLYQFGRAIHYQRTTGAKKALELPSIEKKA